MTYQELVDKINREYTRPTAKGQSSEKIDLSNARYENIVTVHFDDTGAIVWIDAQSLPKKNARDERINYLKTKIKEALAAEDYRSVSILSKELTEL